MLTVEEQLGQAAVVARLMLTIKRLEVEHDALVKRIEELTPEAQPPEEA